MCYSSLSMSYFVFLFQYSLLSTDEPWYMWSWKRLKSRCLLPHNFSVIILRYLWLLLHEFAFCGFLTMCAFMLEGDWENLLGIILAMEFKRCIKGYTFLLRWNSFSDLYLCCNYLMSPGGQIQILQILHYILKWKELLV